MAKTKSTKDALKFDKRNTNNHSERSKLAVRKSLADLGAGRSVVVDSENTVIAGNCTLEQANELGLKIQVVETDGSKLVVVRRTDLTPNDPRRRLLAIADNQTAKLSEFDDVALAKEMQQIDRALVRFKLPLELTVTGFDMSQVRPLLSPPAAVVPVTAETKPTKKQTAASGNVGDISISGRQTDGRAIYFGQDQIATIQRALDYADAEQGDDGGDTDGFVRATSNTFGTVVSAILLTC